MIIGAGQAAAQAAASIRQAGTRERITIVGQEPVAPYQRPPLSKKYLAGDFDAARLELRPAAFYATADIELRLARRANRIDTQRKSVELDDGASISYDRLLLATGARPRRLPGAPEAVRGICYLRTKADTDELSRSIAAGRKVTVIGGGYIGLEVAATATKLGATVTVVEAAPRLLARVAGPEIAEFFATAHAAQGVTLLLGSQVREWVTEGGRVSALGLDDGTMVPTDIVVIGIGAVPNVELAESAGLEVRDGVVVDEFCQTSDPHIFAAGDCANTPCSFYGRRLRLESVQNAIDQAKAAASNMRGLPQPYRFVPWFWSDQYQWKFQGVGIADGYDSVEIERFPAGGMAATYRCDGSVIAVQTINAPAFYMTARRALEDMLVRKLEEVR